ncbi:MAG: tetratricopeptide repeat protein [Phycisphaerales bacterium]|nr:MAG: tetratricopeptide repeat protein [Phycisphaerales bacterium]
MNRLMTILSMEERKVTVVTIAVTIHLMLTCPAALSCTVFSASDGTTVLAGNNEDYYNISTRIWFLPRENGKFGRVYFGFDDFVRQGGMNDQGLFFDTVSAPKLQMPQYKYNYDYPGDFLTMAMEKCATVREVTTLLRDIGPFLNATDPPSTTGAFMFADKSGQSVIIEGDVHIMKEGRFQVMTNFYQSRPELGGYPCRRYDIAKEMLQANQAVTVDLFRRVLAATHQEHEVGASNPTVYSNIYDLKKGDIHIYHYHNFTNVVVLNLAEELRKGRHQYDLPSLFPETLAATVYESTLPITALRRVMKRGRISEAGDTLRRSLECKRWCPPEQLNRLGYELMGQGKMPEAIEVFKLYVETHPDDWNAYDSLGEAYMNNGKIDPAIQNYEKSLRLNPRNTNGAKMLEKLRIERESRLKGRVDGN